MTEPRTTSHDEALIAFARTAAEEVADAGSVGEYVGSVDEGGSDVVGDLTAHNFVCLRSGYAGWYWSVSVSAGPTVNDVVLLPGEQAIIAPVWTPYRERIRPGDLGPGDLLPPEADDIRLVPAWSAGDSQDTVDRYFAREVGLGREWVLSLAGRGIAADRWLDSDYGPNSAIAEQAPATCASCGFLISLAGPLSDRFGVCANGTANADGHVVALTHGCGAHSKAKLSRSAAPQALPSPVFDTFNVDEIDSF